MIRRTLALLGLLALTACAPTASEPQAASRVETRAITVFAAASLRETFATLVERFEASHPGTEVTLNFGASSTLATQITEGAPADVFASASPRNMKDVVATGHATDPKIFARNVLTIAVPAGNPGQVKAPSDLARPGIKVALCQLAVPCGVLADAMIAKAGLAVTPVTREADVKAVLTKVSLGEVDAGLVYVSDARAAAGKVESVPLPADINQSTDYLIAPLVTSRDADLSRAFAAYVASAEAAGVLTEAGFVRP